MLVIIKNEFFLVDKTVKLGTEQKSTVNIALTSDFVYDTQNKFNLDAVCTLLTTKLLENIREKESGVYSIGARPMAQKYPFSESMVSINFNCSPENVDRLSKIVFDEIHLLQKNGPTDVDLQKVIEKKKREREISLNENKYWLRSMEDFYFSGLDINKFNEIDALIGKISKESMKKAANQFLNEKNYLRVSLKPKD